MNKRNKKTLIAVFVSTHETLRAEKEFKEAGVKIRTTIKPRLISSDCQLALTFAEDDLARISQIVHDEILDLKGFYKQALNGEWIGAEID